MCLQKKSFEIAVGKGEVTSNFFLYSIFYSSGEFFAAFIKLKLSSANTFSVRVLVQFAVLERAKVTTVW